MPNKKSIIDSVLFSFFFFIFGRKIKINPPWLNEQTSLHKVSKSPRFPLLSLSLWKNQYGARGSEPCLTKKRIATSPPTHPFYISYTEPSNERQQHHLMKCETLTNSIAVAPSIVFYKVYSIYEETSKVQPNCLCFFTNRPISRVAKQRFYLFFFPCCVKIGVSSLHTHTHYGDVAK